MFSSIGVISSLVGKKKSQTCGCHDWLGNICSVTISQYPIVVFDSLAIDRVIVEVLIIFLAAVTCENYSMQSVCKVQSSITLLDEKFSLRTKESSESAIAIDTAFGSAESAKARNSKTCIAWKNEKKIFRAPPGVVPYHVKWSTVRRKSGEDYRQEYDYSRRRALITTFWLNYLSCREIRTWREFWFFLLSKRQCSIKLISFFLMKQLVELILRIALVDIIKSYKRPGWSVKISWLNSRQVLIRAGQITRKYSKYEIQNTLSNKNAK